MGKGVVLLRYEAGSTKVAAKIRACFEAVDVFKPELSSDKRLELAKFIESHAKKSNLEILQAFFGTSAHIVEPEYPTNEQFLGELKFKILSKMKIDPLNKQFSDEMLIDLIDETFKANPEIVSEEAFFACLSN